MNGPNLVMSNTVGRYEDGVFGIVRNEIQIHVCANSLSEGMYHRIQVFKSVNGLHRNYQASLK